MQTVIYMDITFSSWIVVCYNIINMRLMDIDYGLTYTYVYLCIMLICTDLQKKMSIYTIIVIYI